MSEQLELANLEIDNLKDHVKLLERQLSDANRALVRAHATLGIPPVEPSPEVEPSPDSELEFDANNMTKNEKKALDIGIRGSNVKFRRVWKLSRKIERDHPEWIFDLRRGKMYIFFGYTDVYGNASLKTYGIRLSCLGETFAIKPVFGHFKTIKMKRYENIKKGEVRPLINIAATAWNNQIASEDMTVPVMNRVVDLMGPRKNDKALLLNTLFLAQSGQ